MLLGNIEYTIITDGARRLGIAVEPLLTAIEDESATELAAALHINQAEAQARLAPLLRAATVEGDWGAGCRILTDEVHAELQDALRELLAPRDYSASSGVSQG